MDGGRRRDGNMITKVGGYDLPDIRTASGALYTWCTWYIGLKREVACPWDMPKCQKTLRLGEGEYDSQAPFPLVSTPPHSLSLCPIPPSIISSGFGRPGRPAERSVVRYKQE